MSGLGYCEAQPPPGGPRDGTLSTHLDFWFSGLRCDPVQNYVARGLVSAAMDLRPMRTWHVYRLIDPRSCKPFYVGCTPVAKDRFQDHVDDPAAAARSRCQELRDLGLHPRLKIVCAFDGKHAAYDFACRLILETRGLVNAPLEFVRWTSTTVEISQPHLSPRAGLSIVPSLDA